MERATFFDSIIREERNALGDAIFDLIDPEHDENLEFG